VGAAEPSCIFRQIDGRPFLKRTIDLGDGKPRKIGYGMAVSQQIAPTSEMTMTAASRRSRFGIVGERLIIGRIMRSASEARTS
jgi:hypothetical protein